MGETKNDRDRVIPGVEGLVGLISGAVAVVTDSFWAVLLLLFVAGAAAAHIIFGSGLPVFCKLWRRAVAALVVGGALALAFGKKLGQLFEADDVASQLTALWRGTVAFLTIPAVGWIGGIAVGVVAALVASRLFRNRVEAPALASAQPVPATPTQAPRPVAPAASPVAPLPPPPAPQPPAPQPTRGPLGFDVNSWRGVDPLTLREAACLWQMRDPARLSSFQLDGGEAGILRQLQQAAERGDLPYTMPGPQGPSSLYFDPSPVSEHSRVSRDDLLKFARSIGEVPTFLLKGGEKKLVSTPAANAPLKVAALKLSEPKFALHGLSGGKLSDGECTALVTNESQMLLSECLAVVETVETDGEVDTVMRAVKTQAQADDGRTGRFKLSAGQNKVLRLCSRNYKDIISNPPYHLLLEGDDYPLYDGFTYRVTIALCSEAPFPTKVQLEFSISREKPGVRLLDQGV